MMFLSKYIKQFIGWKVLHTKRFGTGVSVEWMGSLDILVRKELFQSW